MPPPQTRRPVDIDFLNEEPVQSPQPDPEPEPKPEPPNNVSTLAEKKTAGKPRKSAAKAPQEEPEEDVLVVGDSIEERTIEARRRWTETIVPQDWYFSDRLTGKGTRQFQLNLSAEDDALLTFFHQDHGCDKAELLRVLLHCFKDGVPTDPESVLARIDAERFVRGLPERRERPKNFSIGR